MDDKNSRFVSESGVAMIEVLIAIIVVSFGLLGVAGLQLAGMKSNQTAYLRSTATAQAYNMADRMRANMDGVRDKSYDDITSDIPIAPACSSSFSVTNGCSATEMATYDAYAWQTSNGELLPGGSGTVKKVKNSNHFEITVTWSEKCEKKEDNSCSTGTLSRSFSTKVLP